MEPIGLLYHGKRTKLTVNIELVESLIEFTRYIKGNVLLDFPKRYRNILDLFSIPVQGDALVILGQYWDDTLRCFTFPGCQLAPTIEEYGELLRMPLKKGDLVYKFLGYLPLKKAITKLLEVNMEEIQIACPGKIEGIPRKYVEAHLQDLA